MLRIRYFKLPRHTSFEYKPLYYNAEREELMQRVERAKREAGGGDKDVYVQNIRGQFKSISRDAANQQAMRKANIRLAVIFILLMSGAYWLFGDFWSAILYSIF